MLKFIGYLVVMAIASYLPRVIPLVFCRKKITSKFILSFLYYMPYAVISALTFPYIMFSTNSVAVSAIVTAIILALSYFRINTTICALIGVALAFGLSFIL